MATYENLSRRFTMRLWMILLYEKWTDFSLRHFPKIRKLLELPVERKHSVYLF